MKCAVLGTTHELVQKTIISSVFFLGIQPVLTTTRRSANDACLCVQVSYLLRFKLPTINAFCLTSQIDGDGRLDSMSNCGLLNMQNRVLRQCHKCQVYFKFYRGSAHLTYVFNC